MQSRTWKRTLGARLIGLIFIIALVGGALVMATFSALDDDSTTSPPSAAKVIPRTSYVDDFGDVPYNPRAIERGVDPASNASCEDVRWRHPDSRGEPYTRFPELHSSSICDSR
jgi:hypothetical protein